MPQHIPRGDSIAETGHLRPKLHLLMDEQMGREIKKTALENLKRKLRRAIRCSQSRPPTTRRRRRDDYDMCKELLSIQHDVAMHHAEVTYANHLQGNELNRLVPMSEFYLLRYFYRRGMVQKWFSTVITSEDKDHLIETYNDTFYDEVDYNTHVYITVDGVAHSYTLLGDKARPQALPTDACPETASAETMEAETEEAAKAVEGLMNESMASVSAPA